MADNQNNQGNPNNNSMNQDLLSARESESVELMREQDAQTTGQKILRAVDIFAFLPVPRTSPISTKRSIMGSFILLGVFLSYLIYSVVQFFIANYPRMNQYSIPLENQKQPVPDFAFGYIFGEQLNESFYDPRYFTFKFQMVEKTTEIDQKTTYKFGPQYCNSAKYDKNLDWIGAPYNDTSAFELWCPDPSEADNYYMEGLLYASPVQVYPRVTTDYCNNITSLLFCQPYDDLLEITSGGRLYIFGKQGTSTNWATGKETQGQKNFQLSYYFLVPGSYNRAEQVLQIQENTKMPDYLTSFTSVTTNNTVQSSQNFYVSDVTYYNPFSGFQIWMRLSDSISHVDIVYDTIIDQVSQWGAFWGVLFSAFAFYFLAYNTNKFYSKNKDWANFDQGLQKIDDVQNTSRIESRNPTNNNNFPQHGARSLPPQQYP